VSRAQRFWRGPWPPLIGYLLLALLLARNAAGRDFLTHRDGDARMLMLPLWQFTAAHLQAGDIPFWNPAIFAGLPHLGGFLPALCYPTTWLLALLPAPTAMSIHIVGHLVLAGMGVRSWSLQRGASPGGAAIAGLCWAFSWSVLGQAAWGTTPQVAALAWIPWTCCWAERAMDLVPDRVPRLRDTVLAAAGIAAIAFSGHPQYLYLTVLLLGLLGLAGGRPLGWRRAWRPLARLVPAGLLGGAVAAVQLWPGLYFLLESSRAGGLSAEVAASYNLPPRHLLLAAVPGILGPNTADTLPYWGEWNAFDGVAAMALPALLLAACATLHRGRRTGLWWCIGAGLLLAMGDATPVWRLAGWVLPGLEAMRTPSRLAFFAVLAASMLAGFGATALLGEGVEGRRAGRRLAWAGGVAALITGAAVAVLLAGGAGGDAWRGFVDWYLRPNDRFSAPVADSVGFLQDAHRHAVLVLITACAFGGMCAGLGLYRAFEKTPAWLTGTVLWILLAVSGFAAVGGALPVMAPGHLWLPSDAAEQLRLDDPQVRWVNDTNSPNLALTDGSRTLGGWGPVLPARTARLLERAEQAPAGTPLFVRPLRTPGPVWDAAAVHFVVSQGRGATVLPGLPTALQNHPGWRPRLSKTTLRGFERVDPVPRARLLHRSRVASSEAQALEWIATGATDPRTTVVLERAGAGVALPPSGAVSEVAFAADTPDRVELAVDAAAPGILVLADAWAAGWRVTVDGAEAEPLHADFAFRGVAVPAGRHTVVWRYHPPGLPAGLALSLLGLLACAALLTWERRVRAARPGAAVRA
jgi:hypothetical protein